MSMTIMNLVIPKAGAKDGPLFNKPASALSFNLTRGGFVEHVSLTEVAQQSVTQIISLTFVNLVTPKARAEQEHLFNNLRPVC
jgi:hypothetical protein